MLKPIPPANLSNQSSISSETSGIQFAKWDIQGKLDFEAPSHVSARNAARHKQDNGKVEAVHNNRRSPTTSQSRGTKSSGWNRPTSPLNRTSVHHSPYPNWPIPLKDCVSLDCEMVGVGPQKQSVLARVSMVDHLGQSILDVHIKVAEKVTDYRTHVSGIRPDDLHSPDAIDFGSCRKMVIELCAGRVLVGHAIGNDMKVLRLQHPWHMIRDTSQYVTFMRHNDETGTFQPRRLRDLVRQFLGASIQTHEHDSLEDARAAMHLYKLVKNEWDYWACMSAMNFSAQQLYATTSSPHYVSPSKMSSCHSPE